MRTLTLFFALLCGAALTAQATASAPQLERLISAVTGGSQPATSQEATIFRAAGVDGRAYTLTKLLVGAVEEHQRLHPADDAEVSTYAVTRAVGRAVATEVCTELPPAGRPQSDRLNCYNELMDAVRSNCADYGDRLTPDASATVRRAGYLKLGQETLRTHGRFNGCLTGKYVR